MTSLTGSAALPTTHPYRRDRHSNRASPNGTSKGLRYGRPGRARTSPPLVQPRRPPRSTCFSPAQTSPSRGSLTCSARKTSLTPPLDGQCRFVADRAARPLLRGLARLEAKRTAVLAPAAAAGSWKGVRRSRCRRRPSVRWQRRRPVSASARGDKRDPIPPSGDTPSGLEGAASIGGAGWPPKEGVSARHRR